MSNTPTVGQNNTSPSLNIARLALVFGAVTLAAVLAARYSIAPLPLQENHPSWLTLVQVEEGLQQLQEKPMLLCWGGRDFCFHDAFYREWQQRFPQAESHYFPQGGHYLLEDELDAVKEKIEAFLLTCASEIER